MKKLFPFLILLLLSVSCLKDENGKVEQYISHLKSGDFNIWRMPIFEISDIPQLLKYVRNETLISVEAAHPFSSALIQKIDVTIGMMALWTIEGTRLDADHPSSAPVVKDHLGQNVTQSKVADLYERWWKKNKGESLAHLKEISPFEGTDYSWH